MLSPWDIEDGVEPAAKGFGLVHGLIGVAQQVLGAAVVGRVEDNADGGRERVRSPIQVDRQADAGLYSVGDADRIGMLYDGVIRFMGTPEEIQGCEDPVVKGFIEGKPELLEGAG